MHDNDWILVKSKEDLPSHEKNGQIYETVTINGRLALAEYDENWPYAPFRDLRRCFEAIKPVAYREVKLPEEVINHITALRREHLSKDAGKQQLVEYWDNII